MENPNFQNLDPEMDFEELLQAIDTQKSHIDAIRAKFAIRLGLVERSAIKTKKDATQRIQQLETDLAEAENLLAQQEIEIERLLKISEKQKIDAERFIRCERVLRVVKSSCLKSHASSKKFWTIRRFAAIHFMEFVAKILNRYEMLNQDEFDIVFPQKAAKRIKSLAIKIPTEDEKKKKLRDWKRIWRWKKDT